jgi:3-oxoadipate enol-lactonase
MPVISRPDALINFEVWGDSGSWMTLVNGHLRPLTDFRMLGQRLVKAGFRVLALDNRGAGQSRVEQDFQIQDMVDDVVAVWDQIGCQSSHVLGISMGGFISQRLALEASGRVQRLILMSTAASASVLKQDEPAWDTDTDKVLAKLSTYFASDFVRRNPLLVQSMARQMARAAESGELQIQARLQRQAIRGFSALAQLPGISSPTLVIHGEEDSVIPCNEGSILASGIPGARFLKMPATGHLILAERPKELLEAILGFIGPQN